MKEALNLLIVEDEELAARKLNKMAVELEPNLCCLAITDSIASTVAWLKGNAMPDLILMDIELADGQSFEIFSRVDVRCPVIFTTAYDEFALKAFKVNSVDYLLKPVKHDELRAAFEKFRYLRSSQSAETVAQPKIGKLIESLVAQQQGTQFRERFLVRSGQRLMPLSADAIAYFFTEDKLVFLRTCDNRKFVLDYTLDELEQQLDPRRFFRANRQYILNNYCIEEVHTWFNGKLKVNVRPKTEEEVIVSREKAGDFKAWMGE
jgi:two-component system LytT family response regulator